MGPQKNQVALITGATSGLGRALALLLLENGWSVWGTGRKESSPSELASQDGYTHLFVDLSDSVSVQELLDSLERDSRIQSMDLIVLNAGVAIYGALEALPASEMRKVFQVNYFSNLEIIKFSLPWLRRSNNRPCVLVVSSIQSSFPLPLSSAYAGSKAALSALAKTLNAELSGQKIDVILFEPGVIHTDFKGKTNWYKTEHFELYRPSYQLLQQPYRTSHPRPKQVAKYLFKLVHRSHRPFRVHYGWDARLIRLAMSIFSVNFLYTLLKHILKRRSKK